MISLPALFLERLQRIIPPEHFLSVRETFRQKPSVTLRVNTLLADPAAVCRHFDTRGIPYEAVSGIAPALVISEAMKKNEAVEALLANGSVFIQNLSSMMPVIVLGPQPEERVLDACAAPGSKTSFIAARMRNTGEVDAVDAVPKRVYKLRSVLAQLGVQNTRTRCCDLRRFRAAGPYDRVLVDAPCSSEGRFRVDEPASYAYWSERKIREMVRKQRGILLAAGRLVKAGGTLVYSTCSFGPEENEGVVDWFLKKTAGTFVPEQPLLPAAIPTYAPLCRWGKKQYAAGVGRSVRILPSERTEGFFLALFRRVPE